MRVIVMVKATDESEAGLMPEPEIFEAMGRFNDELMAAGVLKAGDGLKPSAHGARVRFDGASRHVTPGPFGPAEELVAGFWLWEVRDLEEAIGWVKRCPNPMPGPSDIEIRPLYEMEDFGDALPPDVAAQEAEHRRRLDG
ncbi:YciI family protein [Cereibacter johrii]|uniref:YciI family protein n=1 Tax=Cereibacter johrii TaxID=445629 RepID=UPI003CF9C33E